MTPQERDENECPPLDPALIHWMWRAFPRPAYDPSSTKETETAYHEGVLHVLNTMVDQYDLQHEPAGDESQPAPPSMREEYLGLPRLT